MNTSNDPKRERPPAEPATQSDGKSAVSPTGATERPNADDDEDEWRHEPIAPVDERNPLKSFGRTIADVVTGGAEAEPKPKKPGR